MKRMISLALLGLLAVTAQAAEPDGKKLFQQRCAMCHNAFGMGTGLLARRVKPEVAELEKREDLTAAYVEKAARIGLLNMPPITRGDVSDRDLHAIALYVSKGKP
jgi:mono/diheme cytochrome c family protein